MMPFPMKKPVPSSIGSGSTSSHMKLVLFVVFLFHALQLGAWVYAPDRENLPPLKDLASGTFIVLDPDQWSTSEVLSLRKQGLLPIARLNIAHRERGRTFSHLIDEKWLVVPKFSPPPDPTPVRFYLAAWQKLLLSRVDQIAHLGFAGLFLEGSAAAVTITDHPTIEREMQTWVAGISRHFKGLGIGPGHVFLKHEAGPLPSPGLFKMIDGIMVSELWYNIGGRNRHPWDRVEPLKRLAAWTSLGKNVLTLEFPRTPLDRNRVADEARSAGFDPAFAAPKGEHR